MKARLLPALLLTSLLTGALQAQPGRGRAEFARNYDPPRLRRYAVNGVDREAFVYAPRTAQTAPSPVVFAFHGHGGTMEKSAEMFGIHQEWPEAVVVYPQGLPASTPGDPDGTKPGWVCSGPDAENRDLKFFDQLLAALEQDYQIDRQRIYATGNSNGGFFTFTLWSARGDVLAAVAPNAATTGRMDGKLTPKAVMVIGGERDPLVKIQALRRTIDELRELNGCGEPQSGRRQNVTVYPSSQTPVVAYIHPGGHSFPREASGPLVAFFKRHPRSSAPEPATP